MVFRKMIVIYIQLLVSSFASDFGLPQMRTRLYPQLDSRVYNIHIK